MKYLATVPVLILLAALLCHARQPTEGGGDKAAAPAKQSEAARRMSEILDDEQQKGSKEPGKSILPDASGVDGLDAPTKERYYAAMREYYGYRVSGYKHRMDIFEWQFLSSKIIFFVVILLVLTGVYFSGVQFHSSLRRSRGGASVPTEVAADVVALEKSEFTEIEASVKGIRVSSPVLGVVILVISFMFFYLYLLFVYPIVDAF
jgi:hypothetical protein